MWFFTQRVPFYQTYISGALLFLNLERVLVSQVGERRRLFGERGKTRVKRGHGENEAGYGLESEKKIK